MLKMRIGIAVKPGLLAARDQLVELEAWLRDRGVDAVWSTEAAKLFTAATRYPRDRTEIPRKSDLVVVLGGDGTLLGDGQGHRRERARHADPRRELRLARLPDRDHAARRSSRRSNGDRRPGVARFAHDAARRATRRGPAVSHMALNDVVFSRTALSRMIELSKCRSVINSSPRSKPTG